jgi:hypothetical protein
MEDQTANDAVPKVYEVYPHLHVRGGAAAIDFYKHVFGAEELMRLAYADGPIAHAELKLGSATILLADEHPEYGVRSPLSFGGTGSSLIYTLMMWTGSPSGPGKREPQLRRSPPTKAMGNVNPVSATRLAMNGYSGIKPKAYPLRRSSVASRRSSGLASNASEKHRGGLCNLVLCRGSRPRLGAVTTLLAQIKMKKSVAATSPDAYVTALDGWRRTLVEDLRGRAGCRCTGDVIERGHLANLAKRTGPADSSRG